MFPLQQGNELCFQISSNPDHHNNIPQDLILPPHPSLLYASDVADNKGNCRQRQLMSMDNNNDKAAADNNTGYKKLMHRDIERQRRQEMASLYASLRSLLPLEYIKGKRSISDHMNEAVNYIKHLRKRIKELDAKRDKLKQQTDLKAIPSNNSSSGSSSNCSQNTGVIIRSCLGGIEIVFSSGLAEQGLNLSTVLQVLLQAEIPVLNCVSTKVNGRVFHTIQAEVKDPNCLTLSGLQQKLTSLVP